MNYLFLISKGKCETLARQANLCWFIAACSLQDDNANSEQTAADKVDPVAVDEEDSNSADATNDVSELYQFIRF